MWAYADVRLDGVQRLAELAQPDIIKIDPGEPGSIETTWVDNDIPAITLEIGPAKNWNQTLIKRSEEFVWRLLNDLDMLPDNYTSPVETASIGVENTFKASNISSVSVNRSGWVQMDVVPLVSGTFPFMYNANNLKQDVEKGQAVGTVFNSWGDIIQNLTASVTGRVLTVRVDAAVEQGAGVLDIVYNATSSS